MKKLLRLFLLIICCIPCFCLLTACNNKFKLNKTHISLEIGETFSLKAYKGKFLENVEWESEDETILTVDNYGLVTALSVGQTKVNATYEDETIYCEVEVTQPQEFVNCKSEFIFNSTVNIQVKGKIYYGIFPNNLLEYNIENYNVDFTKTGRNKLSNLQINKNAKLVRYEIEIENKNSDLLQIDLNDIVNQNQINLSHTSLNDIKFILPYAKEKFFLDVELLNSQSTLDIVVNFDIKKSTDYYLLEIKGYSCMPDIAYGDYVINEKMTPEKCENLKIGDYITWSRTGTSFVTHKIVAIDKINKMVTTSQTDYYTQPGDEPPIPDVPVSYDKIYGKVVEIVSMQN